MTDIAIKVEGIGKRYRLGGGGVYRTLRESLMHMAGAPLRLFSGRNGRSPKHIWALKDVDFEVCKGEVIGVIGPNGAGKSTLLKILSRITPPTAGRAEISGRVRALLEVGTGFHPELTGRENVFLNGAILGMRKSEIRSKFEEIIAFAGIGDFLDTPVKRYSSGMYVRLAFSVAAHLEPEILLVDEVLAVGDVAFQKKCLGKMELVAKKGRTVFLVSHNMDAIRNLCSRTILLEKGSIAHDGDTSEAIARYLNANLQKGPVAVAENLDGRVEGHINHGTPSIRFREISLQDRNRSPKSEFTSNEEIHVAVEFECFTPVNDLRVVLHVVDEDNVPILISQTADDVRPDQFAHLDPGIHRTICRIPADLLGQRRFYITTHLIYPKVEHLILNKVLGFDVNFLGYNNVQYGKFEKAWLRPRLSWSTESLSESEGNSHG